MTLAGWEYIVQMGGPNAAAWPALIRRDASERVRPQEVLRRRRTPVAAAFSHLPASQAACPRRGRTLPPFFSARPLAALRAPLWVADGRLFQP
jgi:hypothetical protein